ncbi:MAG: hypothetical protein E7813_17310 [Bradyrhizobium sp.]|uniref:hypothetical protein n=1 Tax=Bradyrhizobium sp. TaxID=376 RepID=UPI0011F4378A|nr:hypothetical protein [Bradyrhizobium sp.]THD63994.1 MAG: hypothetical protein E7813_17310 [Bradyrhizobium sp.]
MDDAGTIRVTRALRAASLLLACCAIAIFAFRSLAGPLWLDELLTMTLVQADSLPRLWSGIIAGIDGNPPLYLTAAWLIVHAMPRAVSSVAALELTNLALTMAATIALYRVSRRAASATACWIGTFLFAALNDNLIHIAVELRTYALYFFMAALAVLFQQRLIERHRPRDVAALALLYAGLTLAHTFGIVYVGCIALAGGLSQPQDGWPHWRRIAVAVIPAIVVLAAWMPFFVQQSAVGRPYMWVGPPGLPDLLESLFASKLSMWIAIVELGCLASAAVAGLRRGGLQLRTVFSDPAWQPLRYLALVLIGISGFTLAAWTVSVALFPLFVPRYFTPQLIVGFALHIAFCEWLTRLARQRLEDPASLAVYAAVVPPLLLSAVMLSRDPFHNDVPCSNSAGTAFETGFVNGDMPVIAESPHVFLPRATYANHREAYRFPLDWDVVLNYPERARGNAVDYNIMRSLQKWGPMPAVMPTEDIVRNFPQFLAIEQSGRAWFHNLRTTRDVVAEKLGATDDQSCTLWKVTSVQPRR